MIEKPYHIFDEQNASKFISNGVDPKLGNQRFNQEVYIKPLEQVESELVSDTDTVIGILDGSIMQGNDHFLDEERRYEGQVDAVIYLDKSARPVRALVDQLWGELSDTEKPPVATFLNIDKENYILDMGYSQSDFRGGKYIDPDELTLDKLEPSWRKEVTARIRALYISDPANLEKAEALLDKVEAGESDAASLDEIWKFATTLDDAHVAIVDEVKSSKATLAIADRLLQEAFPDTKLEPIFWSTPPTMIYDFYDQSEEVMVKKIADSERPFWYDASTSQGRGGIENKNIEWSGQSTSRKQRIGKYVLSVPYTAINESQDTKGKLIRDDITTLAERFRTRQIKYRPSLSREVSDFKQKVEAYYGLPFDQWRETQR